MLCESFTIWLLFPTVLGVSLTCHYWTLKSLFFIYIRYGCLVNILLLVTCLLLLAGLSRKSRRGKQSNVVCLKPHRGLSCINNEGICLVGFVYIQNLLRDRFQHVFAMSLLHVIPNSLFWPSWHFLTFLVQQMVEIWC